MAGKPGRSGRKSLGERRTLVSRMPPEQYALYEARAAEAGLSLSDYVAEQLAKLHGLPVPSYIQQRRQALSTSQQELQISA